jgi:hypothetical protein
MDKDGGILTSARIFSPSLAAAAFALDERAKRMPSASLSAVSSRPGILKASVREQRAPSREPGGKEGQRLESAGAEVGQMQ